MLVHQMTNSVDQTQKRNPDSTLAVCVEISDLLENLPHTRAYLYVPMCLSVSRFSLIFHGDTSAHAKRKMAESECLLLSRQLA